MRRREGGGGGAAWVVVVVACPSMLARSAWPEGPYSQQMRRREVWEVVPALCQAISVEGVVDVPTSQELLLLVSVQVPASRSMKVPTVKSWPLGVSNW